MNRTCAALALAAAAGIAAAGRASPVVDPRVVPVLYVPSDMGVPRAAIALQIQAVSDVRDWYAARLRGPTFRAEPLVVQRSRHTFAELAGGDFQNWWPLPAAEFASWGQAWNERSRIKLLLLARGAGAWAGADSENGGIDAIADAARVPKGDLGGLAVVGDSSVAGILADACPRAGASSWRKPEGGTAWWCNWNTYRGTIAHELGHTWGLPHPDALLSGFRCDSAVATNMQCHWAWPGDSLLPYEVTHLRSLSYFAAPQSMAAPMLSSLPARVRRGVAISVAFERGDSLLWVGGRGGGTGYPWGVLLRAGKEGRAEVEYTVPRAAWLVADLGRSLGDSGRVTVSVHADGRPLFHGELGVRSTPHRFRVLLRGATAVTLGLAGSPGASVVFGNARLEAQAIDH